MVGSVLFPLLLLLSYELNVRAAVLDFQAEVIMNYHVGETVLSLQKTTLIPGGSESLVYTTLSGGIGILVPFTSHEVSRPCHHAAVCTASPSYLQGSVGLQDSSDARGRRSSSITAPAAMGSSRVQSFSCPTAPGNPSCV